MGQVVNLRRARKSAAKAKARAEADANAARFGLSAQERRQQAKAARHLDLHRRETEDG